MQIVALVSATLAAVVHCYIFVLESLAWLTPRTRAIFRSGTVEQATQTKFLAFNQGFYNLFLALLVLLGVVVLVAGQSTVGLTLLLAGTGCMFAAALVLVISSPKHWRAATVQGVTPMLAILLLILGVLV